MKISFFEEFPSDSSLGKLKLVDYPTKLYLAASSLSEFERLKKNIKSRHVKEVIFWPVLKEDEGYWLSPFCDRKALLRTIKETKDVNILWDSEVPKKRSLLLTNLHRFFGNKKLIQKFFKEHKGTIYTAEYFPENGISAKILSLLGLAYNPLTYNNKVIKMVYSSMHDFGKPFIEKEVRFGVKNFGKNFLVGLGTICHGIKGDEPLIAPKLLERDLSISKENKVNEVVIFRLGGLTEEYNKILKRFI
jgi:hypothetical protein